MGEIDIDHLMKIYRQCVRLCKKYQLPFTFHVDHGTYETAIEFIGSKSYHPPISENWNQNPDIFCPDLLDYEHKIIIEYEEEVGERQTGSKLARKGHHREGDMDTKRDIRRNLYYEDGKFRVLRIYESDILWQKKLANFLIELTK
jgi:fructose/tagatose bisphosphate aldolase